jgi:hypothetical protein
VNDFVNPKHRDVTLSGGYKDLMDVLAAKNKPKLIVDSEKPYSMGMGYYTKGYLKDVENYLQRFLGSQLRPSLFFFLPTERRFIWLFRARKHPNYPVVVFVFVETDTTCEKAIREVFAEFGIVPASEDIVGHADQLVVKYPLSSVLLGNSKIIKEVLRRAYGMSESDELGFFYHETDPAA